MQMEGINRKNPNGFTKSCYIIKYSLNNQLKLLSLKIVRNIKREIKCIKMRLCVYIIKCLNSVVFSEWQLHNRRQPQAEIHDITLRLQNWQATGRVSAVCLLCGAEHINSSCWSFQRLQHRKLSWACSQGGVPLNIIAMSRMLCICPTTNKLVCAHNTFLYKIVPHYFIYTPSDLHMSLMRMPSVKKQPHL